MTLSGQVWFSRKLVLARKLPSVELRSSRQVKTGKSISLINGDRDWGHGSEILLWRCCSLDGPEGFVFILKHFLPDKCLGENPKFDRAFVLNELRQMSCHVSTIPPLKC